MMELVDETDFRAPQQGTPLVRQAAAILAADQHGAAIGALQQPRDMQQRRFAGARRADQRDDFARPQHQINAVQYPELGSGEPEDAPHTAQFERRAGFDRLRASFETAALRPPQDEGRF